MSAEAWLGLTTHRRLRKTVWLFDLGADIYGWFTDQPIWRSSCARLARLLPSSERLVVADLGCGPGTSAIEIARRRPEAQVIGLDIARRMVTKARRRARGAGLPPGRLDLARADATRLPFRSGSVDVITGHSFLYQVPDRAATLAEGLRVLRPGGQIVLMEPNDRPTSLRRVLQVGRDPRHLIAVALWRPFGRIHGRFTRASLAATLTAAGFVDCRVEETLGGLGLLASASRP